MADVLDEIEQTEPGQKMPSGGILHGKGLTWEQAIQLKNNNQLFANLTNEFKPGSGEGMDKYTYADTHLHITSPDSKAVSHKSTLNKALSLEPTYSQSLKSKPEIKPTDRSPEAECRIMQTAHPIRYPVGTQPTQGLPERSGGLGDFAESWRLGSRGRMRAKKGETKLKPPVSFRRGCEYTKEMWLSTFLLICGLDSYVAPGFDWQLALAYSPSRRHITFRAQSVRRNDINPLSSAHLLVRVVSFTSQVASALAFISRSISASICFEVTLTSAVTPNCSMISNCAWAIRFKELLRVPCSAQ